MSERERRRRRSRRPYGPEEGTVTWLCSVRKCKCLCSHVYTSVSCARAQRCLPGCFLCIIFKLALFLFCFLLSEKVCFPCASFYCTNINHRGLTWKLLCRLIRRPSYLPSSPHRTQTLRLFCQWKCQAATCSSDGCFEESLLVKAVAMATFSLGATFFSWVAVGSQTQGNCMNSEKGEVNMSFPWLRKMKKKEVTAALDSSF